MTYEIYRYIFWGGAILSGVMFAVSVAVFFLLKIPSTIGDLTGSNARKAIENIRSRNESTGVKTYKTSMVNLERGKITDKISQSGRILKDPSLGLHGAMNTEELAHEHTEDCSVSEETTLLSEQTANETTLLSQMPVEAEQGANDASDALVIEYELTFVHTAENIE